MTRLELGTGVGAVRFTPIDFSYSRSTKDGDMPIITYLFGSHFNETKDGVVLESSTSGLQNGATRFTGGKLEIDGDATTTAVLETMTATHSAFTYFFPKTVFHGNAELELEQVGESSPSIRFVHRMRTEFEDVGTGDKLTLDLEAGNSVADTRAQFIIRETRNTVETVLATFDLPTGEKSIDWQIKYLDEGVTKISYKTNNGLPVVLFKGDLSTELSECKVKHEYQTDETSPTRTVKTDFIWCRYPALFSGHDTTMENATKGIVKIFDTMGTEVEADWQQVYAKDHLFEGDRVFENGLLRMRFKSTPEIEFSGWNVNNTAWEVIGSLLPENNAATRATTLHDVIIESYNKSQVKLQAKFGIVDHVIFFKKGMPYARIRLKSKHTTIKTSARRWAVNADTPATNLTDYNQENSHDTNKGNPLNLAAPENISSFTEAGGASRGTDKINDNWFAWYDETDANNTVGWMGAMLIPTTIDVEATSATELKEVRYGWRQETIIAIGMLEGDPTSLISGVPKPFSSGSGDDLYVKWRANAGIFTWPQKPFVRKRR